jgi:hypothetical protein
MAKTLMVIGGCAILAVVVAYPVGSVVVLALPLAVGLGLVWWLTDSPVAVGRARARTWFDRASSPGGWQDADEVAATPSPAGEHHTAEVVVKGASRAGHRAGQRT